MDIFRKLYHAFLFFKCVIELVIIRRKKSKLLLVDFDFTLVNNHFDHKKLEYINKDLSFNEKILQMIECKSDFLPVIFTARSGRTINYIKKNSEWKSYFSQIVYCGITQSKYKLAYFAAAIFTSVLWIDDLSDVDLLTGDRVIHKAPRSIRNLEFIRW